MLMLPSNLRVWVASERVDMRKGCFSLAAMVQQNFKLDPQSEHLFVFFGRGGDKVKILFWDRNGYVLYYKCLSQGRFRPPKMSGARYSMSLSDLTMLLEGIDLTDKRRMRSV